MVKIDMPMILDSDINIDKKLGKILKKENIDFIDFLTVYCEFIYGDVEPHQYGAEGSVYYICQLPDIGYTLVIDFYDWDRQSGIYKHKLYIGSREELSYIKTYIKNIRNIKTIEDI